MRRLACLALAACCAPPAFAQSTVTNVQMPNPDDVANKDMVTVALGGAWVPDYEGSDDYRLIPAAAIRGKVSGIGFTTRGTYLYVDFVGQGRGKLDLDLGPIVGARFNRTKHNLKDDVVDLLPSRKTAIEAGAFAGVSFHGLTNPYDTLAVRLDAVHDVAGAHQSTTFSLNLEFSTPLSRRTYASLSVGAEFVSNRFADYYFSVSPADSAATGGVLPVFNASGGMKNWKANLVLNQSVTGDLLGGLSIFGNVAYSRLVGDFKRSPLVSQRGSASQWLLAAGLAYTF